MVKNKFNYGTIQSIAIAYLVVWSISPPMEIDLIYRILALGSVVIWAGVWLIRENPIVLDKNQLVSIFFLFVVVGVTFIDNGDFNGILKQISFFMLVVSFIMNSYYKDNWDELKWIIPVALVLFIIWNYKTIQVLVDDQSIARRLVRDDEEMYSYLRQGVGGYSLIYPQVCISSAVLMWIIKAFKHNKLYFVIGVVWAITFIRLVLLASYSIAIFASAIGVVLLFFYRGKSGLKAFIFAGILLAIIMFSILYVDGFRNWLLEYFDGTAVAHKIRDLVATNESGVAEDSIEARMIRYRGSLSVIVKYPIIGALWRDSGGGHSGFLDTFAKYGLFGVWFFVKSFYSVPNYYKAKYGNNLLRRTGNAVFVTLLLVSLLNSVTYAVYCVVLLVLPLFFDDIIKWEGIENENTLDS